MSGDDDGREAIADLASRLKELASLFEFHGEHFVAIGLGDADRCLWASGGIVPGTTFYVYGEGARQKLANMQQVYDVFLDLVDEPGFEIDGGMHLTLRAKIGDTPVRFIATNIGGDADQLITGRKVAAYGD